MGRFPFAVVVFDLDGTLANTAPDLTDALNHMLVQLGREQVPGARVIEMVGRGMRDLVERGLGATGVVSPALVEQALPIFLEYYETHIADGSRPYEGAEAALDLLRMRGAKSAICTNKPEQLTHKLLTAFGWSERFASVIGATRYRRASPMRRLCGRRSSEPAAAGRFWSAIRLLMSRRRTRRGCRVWWSLSGFAINRQRRSERRG